MSKALKRLAPVLFTALLCAHAAPAQTTLEWIVFARAGEAFAVLMPKEPLRLEQTVRAGELEAAGQRYTATAAGGARYIVWSLTDAKETAARLKEVSYEGWPDAGRSRHLDLVAEVARELLVGPELERLKAEAQRTGERKMFVPSLAFTRAFELNGRYAREYALRLEGGGGPVYVCADDRRLYVVAAFAPDPKAADSRRFVESFAVGTKTPNTTAAPAAAPAEGPRATGIGPALLKSDAGGGGDASVDYERPFTSMQVTKRAVILFKPEPGFTEEARRFDVVGVVRLRAILNKTGKVTNVTAVRSLPHGLTEKAMAAAKGIHFEPAQKDGREVSQFVVLEYNFQIY